MKKIISILLVLCMALTFTACAAKENVPEGMKDVAPDDEKYNFYVPEAWRTNSGDIVGAYYSMTDRSNVSIMAYGGEYESSEEYWNSFKKSAESVFSKFSVISENEAKVLDGRNAVRYCYAMTLDGENYKCMQTVVSFSNIFYVITYTSTEEYYDNHLEDVEKILSSFDFK